MDLRMATVKPLIGRDVEKNDKVDVKVMLGFLLGQCSMKSPGVDLVKQRGRESDLLAQTLEQVVPVCNKIKIKTQVTE